MSDYDDQELKYSFLSEPVQVPRSLPRSLTLSNVQNKINWYDT